MRSIALALLLAAILPNLAEARTVCIRYHFNDPWLEEWFPAAFQAALPGDIQIVAWDYQLAEVWEAQDIFHTSGRYAPELLRSIELGRMVPAEEYWFVRVGDRSEWVGSSFALRVGDVTLEQGYSLKAEVTLGWESWSVKTGLRLQGTNLSATRTKSGYTSLAVRGWQMGLAVDRLQADLGLLYKGLAQDVLGQFQREQFQPKPEPACGATVIERPPR